MTEALIQRYAVWCYRELESRRFLNTPAMREAATYAIRRREQLERLILREAKP